MQKLIFKHLTAEDLFLLFAFLERNDKKILNQQLTLKATKQQAIAVTFAIFK